MILAVKNLKKYFPVESSVFRASRKVAKALDGVSFSLEDNSILGVVGESGSGKTTLAKLVLKLMEPSAGEISFGPQITNLRKDVGIIFQDPLLSLDPRMRIGEILSEPFIVQHIKKDYAKLGRLLNLVGLEENIFQRYPIELSGGQRQRVCLVRALVLEPKLLVLDEPISSLDLIIQKQILELLIELRDRLKMAYIFISHNIALMKKISTDIIVMLEGKIVEQGKTEEVLSACRSDYTKKLLEAAR